MKNISQECSFTFEVLFVPSDIIFLQIQLQKWLSIYQKITILSIIHIEGTRLVYELKFQYLYFFIEPPREHFNLFLSEKIIVDFNIHIFHRFSFENFIHLSVSLLPNLKDLRNSSFPPLTAEEKKGKNDTNSCQQGQDKAIDISWLDFLSYYSDIAFLYKIDLCLSHPKHLLKEGRFIPLKNKLVGVLAGGLRGDGR